MENQKKSKKINITLLLTIVFLIMAFILPFRAFKAENTSNTTQQVVEIEKQERQPNIKYAIDYNTNDISYDRIYNPICIIEDNASFYILSFGIDIIIDFVIDNNEIYATAFNYRIFIYRSEIVELEDYTGIDATEDYSTPPIQRSITFDSNVPLSSFSYLEYNISISKPYNLNYLTFSYIFELYDNAEDNNTIFYYEEQSLRSFSQNDFTLDDWSLVQIRNLTYDDNAYHYYNFNFFDVQTFYQNGFSSGFVDGENAQRELYAQNDTALSKIWNILESGIETALNVLSIEILPGIPLTICIIVPLIFGIIFFIWKGGQQ